MELCAACPVRPRCLRYALAADFEPFGVWGGTTALERRKVRKRITAEWMGPRLDRERYVEQAAQTRIDPFLPCRWY